MECGELMRHYGHNVHQHSFWKGAFDTAALKKIQKICNASKGPQTSQELDGDSVRTAKIAWLNRSPENEFLYETLTDVMGKLNHQIYRFDLSGCYEPIQYSVYSKGDHYSSWHIDDTGLDNVTPRKLSLTLQLSNPSEYEGGEVQIGMFDNYEIADKEKGSITVFPSFMPHRVTPVTKGKRRSIVLWLTGPVFK